MGDLRYVHLPPLRKAQAFGRGLQARIRQKLVRRYPGLAFEELAQIVVVEGQCAQILVELKVFIRIAENDVLGDFLHNGISHRHAQTVGDEAYDQIGVGRQQQGLLAGIAAEVIEGGGEGVQNKMVAVVMDHGGTPEIQRRIAHIQVDVGKARVTLVLMVHERRDQHHIPGLIDNIAVVKADPAGAAGAVDELPAVVRVPGD